MDEYKFSHPFFLFNYVSDLMVNNADHYFPRFNYSSCELWLCTEICHAVNYDSQGLQSSSAGEWFLYNEDYKRDLTLYSAGKSLAPKIETHIEVKVTYPVSQAKFLLSVNNLCEKLTDSFSEDYRAEGWIFLVWTQHYKLPAEEFFASRIAWIEQEITARDFYDNAEKEKIPYFSEVKDIADGTLKWRGEEKKIIVKAVAFSFRKNFMDAYREIKEEYATVFEILASR